MQHIDSSAILTCARPEHFIKPQVMAVRFEQMDSDGSRRAHAVKQEQRTARYVTQIRLGPETVTEKHGLFPTEDPLKLTLVYPVEGLDSLPHEHSGISLRSLQCYTLRRP